MALSFTKNDVFGVIVGAGVALLFQTVAITLILGVPFEQLMTIWGRYGVAVLLVSLFCVFYKIMTPTKALVASLLFGTLIPSLLAQLAFSYKAHWYILIAFNLLFSVVALLVYRQIAQDK